MRIVNALVRAEHLSNPPPPPFEKVVDGPSPVWVAELRLPGGIGTVLDVQSALEQLHDPIGTIMGGRLCLHLSFEGPLLLIDISLLQLLSASDIALEIAPAA